MVANISVPRPGLASTPRNELACGGFFMDTVALTGLSPSYGWPMKGGRIDAAPEVCFGGPRHDGVLFERPCRGGPRPSGLRNRLPMRWKPTPRPQWLPIDFYRSDLDRRIDIHRSSAEYTLGGGIAPAVEWN